MYEWDWSVVLDNWQLFGWGLLQTVYLVVLVMASALILGFLLALARVSSMGIVRNCAAAYIAVFRGTPLLLQLYIIYQTGPFTSFGAGYLGLTLNLTAFLAEIYRSGLTSVSKRQWEAAYAIGMTQTTALRRIIVPQAILRVIPPLGTFWVSLFRDSALVAFIGVAEVMHAAQQVAIASYRPFEAYTALAVLYFVITYPQARLVAWLYDRFRVRE